MAASLLARVPARTGRAERAGGGDGVRPPGLRRRTHPRARAAIAIEFGPGALVDSLPGVSAGSTWVGTFNREEAVEDEGLDFFASGHPLVEGVFAHFEDSPLGRVARFTVEIDAQTGQGLVAIYKDGPRFDVVALDSSGTARPDWEAALRRRPLRARPVSGPAEEDPAWRAAIRRLSARLDPARRPHAVAAIDVRPMRDERIRR